MHANRKNIMTHEYYVNFETAKLLKEAGFDWECPDKYERSIIACRYEDYEKPTLAVAQRWLREEKGIYIGITAIENKRAVTNSDGWTFHYEYGKPKFDCYIQDERCEDMCTLYDSFDTYEEALEVGIKKSLENIL